MNWFPNSVGRVAWHMIICYYWVLHIITWMLVSNTWHFYIRKKENISQTSHYLTMVIPRHHITLRLFSSSSAFCWSHLCAKNKAQNQTKPSLVLFWSDATSVAFSKKPAQMAEKLLQQNLIKSQLYGIKPYSYWEFVLTMYCFL